MMLGLTFFISQHLTEERGHDDSEAEAHRATDHGVRGTGLDNWHGGGGQRWGGWFDDRRGEGLVAGDGSGQVTVGWWCCWGGRSWGGPSWSGWSGRG